MRNLTELMQEIPLDEMVGGQITVTYPAENNENIVEQTDTNARIKKKTSAAMAIAACAAVAAVGAVQFSLNSFEPISVNEDTDSDYHSYEFRGASDSEFEEVREFTSEEEYENYQISRLYYDHNDIDYRLAEDHIRLMDSKLGEVTSGFQNYDIWIPDVQICYPYYSIEIAVQSKDGSPMPPNSGFLDLNVKVNGNSVGYTCNEFDIYDDTAVGTITISLMNNLGGISNFINDSSKISVEITNLNGLSEAWKYGEFYAEFEAGEFLEKDHKDSEDHLDIPNDVTPMPFTWEIEYEAEKRELVYNVNYISWSNCGFIMNMDIVSGNEGMDDSDLWWAIDNYWFHKLKYHSAEELEGEYHELGNKKNYFDPESDYYFIKMQYGDGTKENFDFDDLILTKNPDGSYTLYFSAMKHPYDSEKVEVFYVGDGGIVGQTYSDNGGIKEATDLRLLY